MLPIIVTLSSIPSRFKHLGPTLQSLLRQNLPVSEIRLHIPLAYRRFPDWDGRLPDVPAGVTIVRVAEDLGPATKLLPAVRDFAGQDVELLLCDDDRIYDRNWTRRFAEARALQPDCVIAEDGGHIEGHHSPRRPLAVRRTKDWRYRLTRIATLGLHRPPKFVTSGHVDIFKGYAGAMLRPDFMPDFAYDIPDILWTVDDIWLSGCLVTNGVGIWMNANSPISHERRIAGQDALLDFEHEGYGRQSANRACWQWFQEHKGIWPESDADEGAVRALRQAVE